MFGTDQTGLEQDMQDVKICFINGKRQMRNSPNGGDGGDPNKTE